MTEHCDAARFSNSVRVARTGAFFAACTLIAAVSLPGCPAPFPPFGGTDASGDRVESDNTMADADAFDVPTTSDVMEAMPDDSVDSASDTSVIDAASDTPSDTESDTGETLCDGGVVCDGGCVNTNTSCENCGACGSTCSGGGFCHAGLCVHDCAMELACGQPCLMCTSSGTYCP